MQDSEKLLKEELGQYLKVDARRLFLIVQLIIGIIKLCYTISYSKLSKVVNPKAKNASNYKRIQRFFKQFKFSKRLYARVIFKLIAKQKGQIILSTDWIPFGTGEIWDSKY